jgi:Sulfotransferase domain
MSEEFITIVSGLPRSGTSMMMQMLEAGGIPILKDDVRQADEDNPKGYYEFERVKKIADDQAWLDEARGRAVKMVSALLPQLPNNYQYKLIFMRRRMEEILASQKVMLDRREQPAQVGDEKMALFFQNHLKQIEKWVSEQPNIDWLQIHYNEMIADPSEPVEKINQFLGGGLDTERMRGVVDRTLYRERATS